MRYLSVIRPFSLAILGYVLLAVGVNLGAFAWPVSFWVDLHGVRVIESYCDGAKPRLFVNKELKHSFTGKWTAMLENVESGKIEQISPLVQNYDTMNLSAVYSESNRIGTWWVVSPKLKLTEGEYRIKACVTVDTHFLPEKVVCESSNIFKVNDCDRAGDLAYGK